MKKAICVVSSLVVAFGMLLGGAFLYQTPASAMGIDITTGHSTYSVTTADSHFSLNAKVNGKKSTDLKYSSSDKKVVKVSKKGTVGVKGAGIAKIYIAYTDPTGQKDPSSTSVKIKVYPEQLTFSLASKTKGTVTITAKPLTPGVNWYKAVYSLSGSKSMSKTYVNGYYSADHWTKKVTGLQSGKTYTFKLRGYHQVSKGYFYGDYSKKQSITVK